MVVIGACRKAYNTINTFLQYSTDARLHQNHDSRRDRSKLLFVLLFLVIFLLFLLMLHCLPSEYPQLSSVIDQLVATVANALRPRRVPSQNVLACAPYYGCLRTGSYTDAGGFCHGFRIAWAILTARCCPSSR
jgi:hypothetical protein